MKRIGLFGGTFDPPHIGHLALAEWALERLGLDRVIFVPAGHPPHKRRRDLSSSRHRLAMTLRAVKGHPRFDVSTLEIDARGPSFTVDTLRAYTAAHPTYRLYLLIGADSLDDFDTWHEPEAIARLATLAVAARPGSGSARSSQRRGRVVWLGNPGIAVSSSLIRKRARRGYTVRYLVPDAVSAYITRHRLYRSRAAGVRASRNGR